MSDTAAKAGGQEVLVVDGDKNVLKGLERLLGEAGLLATTFSDPVRARDQIEKRFIPLVLCDLDTPQVDGGLDLVKFIREKSPLTTVLVMTPRKAFEAVASAFRAGAADVIPKAQDAIPYLRERVLRAAADVTASASREQLLSEVAEVHEEFLRKLMDMQRQLTDLEDRLLSREAAVSGSTAFGGLGIVNLLLVDDEPALNAVLERDLSPEKGWRIRYAQSGGEALDAATQTPPQVLVVKETLPDLPGTMVVKTIKQSAPEAVAMLFTPPAEDGAGQVKVVEASRLLTLIPSFAEPDQLVGALEEVREALRQKARERRYLNVFRKQHVEFLRKYHLVKQRLEAKPGGGPR